MRLNILLLAMVFAVGCSDNTDNSTDASGSTDSGPSTDAGLDSAAELALMTTDGTRITSESLVCIYRQNTGADNSLSLQLQYLESPESVAFALYVTDPIPAEPFAASAGQQGGFDFEVFTDNVGYADQLNNGEVEIRLDKLPSASTLSDGEIVLLKGSLLINQFSLAEGSATGEAGSRRLDLASGSVDIDCEATFQRAAVIN